MHTTGAQRPLLVLGLGSVAAFAVLVGGSQLAGAQPVESCTPKVCSVQFPMHRDGQKMVGSGSAVIFHVPVTLLSVVKGRTRVMVGAHSAGLPVNVAGEIGGLIVRVQELNKNDATLIFSLAPGERKPGYQAR